MRLHRHQEGVLAAARGEPYIVTTGTGSGKSLTYLVPIVDSALRAGSSGVQAIIVYPMNTLINSQPEALERFRERNWPECPVRFGRYTRQEGEEQKNEILASPPLERRLLDALHARRLRLPDRPQFRPVEDVFVQPDFYYKRDGRPGACIFVDGAPHDAPNQAERDRALRDELEERGFQVIAIRHDRPLEEQIDQHPEVFGRAE